MNDLIDRRAQWRPRTHCTLKDLKSSSCLDPPEDTHDQLALLVMLTSLIIQHVSSSLALQTRMCVWEMQGLKMIFTKCFLLIYFIMCSWSEVTFWPCNRSTTHTRMCFLFFFKSSSSSKKSKYNLKKKKRSLTVILHRDRPVVEAGVGVALHHIKVCFHIQENIHARKWADVEEGSLYCSLNRHVTPFLSGKWQTQ